MVCHRQILNFVSIFSVHWVGDGFDSSGTNRGANSIDNKSHGRNYERKTAFSLRRRS